MITESPLPLAQSNEEVGEQTAGSWGRRDYILVAMGVLLWAGDIIEIYLPGIGI